MSSGEWKRVSKANPCPICGKDSWCTVSIDGTVVTCMRESNGAFKCEETDAGFASYHRIAERPDDLPPPPKRKSAPADEPPKLEFVRIAERAENTVSPERLAAFADDLGLSVDSLRRLRVGWSGEHNAWTFPMFDAFGHMRGIRLRLTDGRKLAVKGGHEGLFIPRHLNLNTSNLLCICEGPTDCAALLDMGVEAVGRPSCTGGMRLLRWLVSIRQPREVLIIHDRDEPGSHAELATVGGAQRLAGALASPHRAVWIVQPPAGVKDVRAWRHDGAGLDDLMALLDEAKPIRRGRHDWMRTSARSDVA